MSFYPAVRIKGEIFTVEARLSIDRNSLGQPQKDEQSSQVYLMISPPIDAGKIFEDVTPEIPHFRLSVKTSSACLLVADSPETWGVKRTVQYLRECTPGLVRTLEAIETGTYFNP